MAMTVVVTAIVALVAAPIILGAGLARYLLGGEAGAGDIPEDRPSGLRPLHMWHHAMRCLREAPRRLAGPESEV